jgi:YHS domain-containing protein
MRAKWLLCTFGLAAMLGWCSCSTASAPPAETSQDGAAQNGASPAVSEGGTAGLEELNDADRKQAEKQKVCPVSGEPLGSMGKPYKVTVKGRTFFLCCEGCEAELQAHPDKYLKKLK